MANHWRADLFLVSTHIKMTRNGQLLQVRVAHQMNDLRLPFFSLLFTHIPHIFLSSKMCTTSIVYTESTYPRSGSSHACILVAFVTSEHKPRIEPIHGLRYNVPEEEEHVLWPHVQFSRCQEVLVQCRQALTYQLNCIPVGIVLYGSITWPFFTLYGYLLS